MRVMIYNEYSDGQKRGKTAKVYPTGMHNTLKSIFDNTDIKVETCIFEMPEHGLTQEVLNQTDVLIWWGHCLHDKVDDNVVERICKRVYEGMGIIFLHSAHFSKPFKKLLGTSGSLQWREDNKPERIWCVSPKHPIATDVDLTFRLKKEEMYGEYFDIPKPDDIVYVGWFKGGEVFRSGCTFTRGLGKIFYFQCGHETFPIYYDKNVRKIIYNATMWANNKPICNEFTAKNECKHAVISAESIFNTWRKL